MKRLPDECQQFNPKIKQLKTIFSNDTIFTELTQYFEGIFVGNRLMKLLVPENPQKLNKIINAVLNDNKINNVEKLLNSDCKNSPTVKKHRILRVLIFLEEYNLHYALTQKLAGTFAEPIETIREFNNKKIEESELFADLGKYTTLLPLYLNNNILEPYYGAEVLNSVNDYFKFHDRQYIDLGNKQKCLELLNGPLLELKIVEKLQNFPEHPPVPVNSKVCAVKFFKNIEFLPVPPFDILKKIEKEPDPLPNKIQFKNITALQVPTPSTTFTWNINDSGSLNNFKSLPRNTDTVVLIFKNSGLLKSYSILPHVLFKNINRIESIFRYMIPKNKIHKVNLMVTVKNFN